MRNDLFLFAFHSLFDKLVCEIFFSPNYFPLSKVTSTVECINTVTLLWWWLSSDWSNKNSVSHLLTMLPSWARHHKFQHKVLTSKIWHFGWQWECIQWKRKQAKGRFIHQIIQCCAANFYVLNGVFKMVLCSTNQMAQHDESYPLCLSRTHSMFDSGAIQKKNTIIDKTESTTGLKPVLLKCWVDSLQKALHAPCFHWIHSRCHQKR